MEFLDSASQGMGLLFSWPVLPTMLVGIVLGMGVGLIPGLGGLIGMALLLPFAIGQTPEVAFAFLLGMYAVTTQTDSIPAILLGVPGTASATATALDGYPMAKRGEAGRALSAAYFANIVGAVLSALIFVLILPVLRPILLQFASPEFFMMSLFGLVMVGSMVGGDVFRGLAMAGMGLVLAMVGLSPGSGTPRFVFEQIYLWDGVPLIPLIMGLFAVPELVELATRGTSIAPLQTKVSEGKYSGFKDIIIHRWMVVRVAIIGTVIGAIPGLGGTVAEWLGYSHAVQSAKDPLQFGRGDVRGVIAPETATAAQKPGSILPTIAFGIPGNPVMALLLGVFIMVGLQPGPKMLGEDLDITFLLIFVIVVANIIAAIAALGLQPLLMRLCYIRASLLVPAVLGFMVIGVSTSTGNFGDLVAFGLFGLIGLLLKANNWPRVPLIMGLVLGEIAEPYLFITVDRYGAEFLWNRPVVVIVELMIAGIVANEIRRKFFSGKKPAVAIGEGGAPAAEAGSAPAPLGMGFYIGLAFAALGTAIVVVSFDLPLRERLFPLVGGGMVAISAAMASIVAVMRYRGSAGSVAMQPGATAAADGNSEWRGMALALGWIGILLLATYLLGHTIAVPAFILVYILTKKDKLIPALVIAAIAALFIRLVCIEWLQMSLPPGVLLAGM